jgi:hypothetical protein
VQVDPSFSNTSGDPQTVTGTATNLAGPPGPSYASTTPAAYGTSPRARPRTATEQPPDRTSSPCPARRVPRPTGDAVLTENLSSDPTARHWTVHVGNSFSRCAGRRPVLPIHRDGLPQWHHGRLQRPGTPPATA